MHAALRCHNQLRSNQACAKYTKCRRTARSRSATLLDGVAQRLHVPVIATEQYPKGLGYTEPGLQQGA